MSYFSLNLNSFPILPGYGHACALREFAMKSLGTNVSPREPFAAKFVKTCVNTAMRVTTLALPVIPKYIRTVSLGTTIQISVFYNGISAIAKAIYAPVIYLDGKKTLNQEKIQTAKRIGSEAILHASFWFLDYLAQNYGEKTYAPIAMTYIAAGIVTDLFGLSRSIHQKLFRTTPNVQLQANNDNREVHFPRVEEINEGSVGSHHSSSSHNQLQVDDDGHEELSSISEADENSEEDRIDEDVHEGVDDDALSSVSQRSSSNHSQIRRVLFERQEESEAEIRPDMEEEEGEVSVAESIKKTVRRVGSKTQKAAQELLNSGMQFVLGGTRTPGPRNAQRNGRRNVQIPQTDRKTRSYRNRKR